MMIIVSIIDCDDDNNNNLPQFLQEPPVWETLD